MKYLVILISVVLYAKILIVNSYSPKDQCGIPQLNGFLVTMYSQGFKPKDFEIVFLHARISNKNKMLKKVKKYLKNINKYDFVVTFDDAAFKLIGIPASKTKREYFSGVNYPIKLYKKNFKANWNNICGVYEKLYFKEVLDSYKSFFKPKKIAFFYSDGIGKILKLQYEDEMKNTNYLKHTTFFYIKTEKDLIKKTKEANNYDLFLPYALSIKHNNKKIPFLKFKNIYLKNIKKPDLSINLNFVNLGFLGLGGVDFYKMGVQLAYMILNHQCSIENAKHYLLFINAKRAKKIKFKIPENFLENKIQKIIW